MLDAIEARDNLTEFAQNRSALFALQIEFQIEDIRTVAADAIVDGPDDKGCDVFFIDDQSGRAIICQTYEAGSFAMLRNLQRRLISPRRFNG